MNYRKDMVKDAPERLYGVSEKLIDAAKYEGGCWVNEVWYLYDPPCDTLVRADVRRRDVAIAEATRRKSRGL